MFLSIKTIILITSNLSLKLVLFFFYSIGHLNQKYNILKLAINLNAITFLGAKIKYFFELEILSLKASVI